MREIVFLQDNYLFKYRSALIADFRRYFGVSYFEIGRSISYEEATYLVSELVNTWGSALFRDVNKHDYSVTLEWIAMTGLHDSFRASNHDKKKGRFEHLPRPYPISASKDQQTIGKLEVSSAEEAQKVSQTAYDTFSKMGISPPEPPALPKHLKL